MIHKCCLVINEVVVLYIWPKAILLNISWCFLNKLGTVSSLDTNKPTICITNNEYISIQPASDSNRGLFGVI